MRHNLRFFVWNDVNEARLAWVESIASAMGYSTDDVLSCIVGSSELDPRAIAQIFLREYFDVAILDVMAPGNPTLGLRIAKEIRAVDKLIPIIAVTTQPIEVYRSVQNLGIFELSGVFEASVMNPDSFYTAALQQSLLNWHNIVPDYALVRRCVCSVRGWIVDADPEKSRYLRRLVEIIEMLPFTRTTEAWHKSILEPLATLIKDIGLRALGSSLETTGMLFQHADPFYMASSRSRVHLSHNVKVFLLGLIGLVEIAEVRAAAEAWARPIFGNPMALNPLYFAIATWSCVAMTHDTAYLSQNFKTAVDRLRRLSDTFIGCFPTSSGLGTIPDWNWPSEHHAIVGKRLWELEMAKVGTDAEAVACMELIAKGIFRHDSSNHTAPVSSRDWIEFLAVLSDELQDWGRERPEDGPELVPFRLFGLQKISIGENCTMPDGVVRERIDLLFYVCDFPQHVIDELGCDGQRWIGERITRIFDTLEKNIRSNPPLVIEICVRFVSRNVDDMVKTIFLPE